MISDQSKTKAELVQELQSIRKRIDPVIPERIKTAERIRESEEKYRSIVESSHELIWTTDLKGNLTFINKNGSKFLGYEIDQILGKDTSNFIHPDSLSIARTSFLKVIHGQKRQSTELKITIKDGCKKNILINEVPMLKKNKIVGVMAIAMDITARKQVEMALKESEENYRLIVESSHELIWTTDLKGNLTFINKNGSKFLGYEIDQILGKDTSNFIHPDILPIARTSFLKVIHDRQPQSIELRLIYRDGGERIMLTKEVPLFKNNKTIGVMAFGIDITERKQFEDALKESEEKFRGVVEKSNDGIYVLQDDRFVFINPRYTDITGYKLEEISGEDFDFRIMLSENGLKVLNERSEKQKRGEEVPDRYIFESLRKDGQKRNLEVSVTMIDWQNKPATLGIVSDVTERIKTRKKLEDALEKAKHGEKVKTLFMANMSHEIRTPLNAILGFTELIESSTRHLVGKEEQEFFDTIRNSGQRLMHTIHEVLDISQIEAGTYDFKMEEVDLSSLTSSIVTECRPTAFQKGLSLTFEPDIDEALIQVDQHGITQSISNIIDNAIKYTDEGKITVSLNQSANKYILKIRDTGIGIADEYIETMFEAFTQESEGYTKKFQGIGLGMAIAKSHLDLNQIDIDVKSKKNVGSTFTLTFKAAKNEVKKKEKKTTVAEETKTTIESLVKPLVLVVEDDINSQRLMKFFLNDKFDLCFADSVGGAKEQLKKYPVKLILLDLSLIGNEDGLDLVRWMRKTKTWKETPVIATTAHAFTKDKDNCLVAGCEVYLSKPIKRDILLEKINKYME